MSIFRNNQKQEGSSVNRDELIIYLLKNDDNDKLKSLLQSFNLGDYTFRLKYPKEGYVYDNHSSYASKKEAMLFGNVIVRGKEYQIYYGSYLNTNYSSLFEILIEVITYPSLYGLTYAITKTDELNFKSLKEHVEEVKKVASYKEKEIFQESIKHLFKSPVISDVTMSEEDFGPWLYIQIPLRPGKMIPSGVKRHMVFDDVINIQNKIMNITHLGLNRTVQVKYNYKGVSDNSGLVTSGEGGIIDCEGYRIAKKTALKLDLEYRISLLTSMENSISAILKQSVDLAIVEKLGSDDGPLYPLHDIEKESEELRMDPYTTYNYDTPEIRKNYVSRIANNNDKINEFATVLAIDNRRLTILNDKIKKKSIKNRDESEKLSSLVSLWKSLEKQELALPEEIEDFISRILAYSPYIIEFEKKIEVGFDAQTGMLVVEYSLPSKGCIPTEKTYKLDSLTDKVIPIAKTSKAMDDEWTSMIYSIVLRSTYECYKNDSSGKIKSIVFNGWLKDVNPATGNYEASCIISLKTDRESFLSINLNNVDPIACFRNLKGVSCAKLASIIPITPIMTISREDSRFVESRNVVDEIDEGTNLATMDWQDFEQLIRDVFGKVFNSEGSEVRITQASRDGGVDAIAFDSDPIRGGKIVIQAKRYTNVVGVSAVRDLYGTVLNEGAMKGILVTTSSFGPDSYEFAKDKPLTLLSGGNLLALMEKYGYHARIDIEEARRIMGG